MRITELVTEFLHDVEFVVEEYFRPLNFYSQLNLPAERLQLLVRMHINQKLMIHQLWVISYDFSVITNFSVDGWRSSIIRTHETSQGWRCIQTCNSVLWRTDFETRFVFLHHLFIRVPRIDKLLEIRFAQVRVHTFIKITMSSRSNVHRPSSTKST